MNLIEKLIAADSDHLKKKEEKKVYSRKLSSLLGEDTYITIRELSGRKMNDLNQTMINKKGERDMSMLYETNLMYCVEGIVEPSMKDEKLLEHFGAATPKILTEKLFDSEVGKIADEIINLSGMNDEAEKEIKN